MTEHQTSGEPNEPEHSGSADPHLSSSDQPDHLAPPAASSGWYGAGSGGYGYGPESGSYAQGSGSYGPSGDRQDSGGYAQGSGGYAQDSGGYAQDSGGYAQGSGYGQPTPPYAGPPRSPYDSFDPGLVGPGPAASVPAGEAGAGPYAVDPAGQIIPATSSDSGSWPGGPNGPSGPMGPGGPIGPGGPTNGWGSQPPSQKRRVGLRPVAAVALVVGVTAASVGIGHAVWPTTSNSATPAAASAPASGGSGSGSSGSGSSGSNGSSGSSTDPYSGLGGGGGGGGGGTYSPFGSGSGSSGSGSSGSGSSSSSTEGSGGPSDVSAIAAKVDPALVDINTVYGYQQSDGAGTGIVLTSNGEILTNNHVVEDATSISVTDLGNGKTYAATVVGYDSTDDVAVIQLQHASGLTTAKIADSSKVKAGQAVVAIGNAGGTGGTPTAAGGSVTALNQSITASDELTGSSENLTGLIETNADVQSGDSGGSLVNTSGEVVGMDSAASSGYSLSSQADQGYAIPIDKALSIAKSIEAGNSSSVIHIGTTAFLGVEVTSSSSSFSGDGTYGGSSYGNGSSSGSSDSSGAIVAYVESGTAASQAGLAEGDDITSLDGRTVSSPTDLSSIMATLEAGQSVQIGWTDSSGQTHTATVTLGTGPAQ